LHREERRQAIIAGAAEAFVEHGYEATGLDDVAKAAGISRALLYRHFDTKKAIYQAVIDNFLTVFHSGVVATVDKRFSGDTLSGLVQAAQADPNGFRLFFRHAVREPDFQAYYAELVSKRIAYIETALKQFISSKRERHFKAELMQELVIGTILIWIDNGMLEPKKLLKLLGSIVGNVLQ
jgi:AcrR family transcriptional regulator